MRDLLLAYYALVIFDLAVVFVAFVYLILYLFKRVKKCDDFDDLIEVSRCEDQIHENDSENITDQDWDEIEKLLKTNKK